MFERHRYIICLQFTHWVRVYVYGRIRSPVKLGSGVHLFQALFCVYAAIVNAAKDANCQL